MPWLAGMAGAGKVAGPTVMQACATGVRVLLAAAQEIEAGMAEVALAITCDRTSNGPHLYYPSPTGPGGTGTHEDWVLSNFESDPLGPHSMLHTAENVAAKHGFGTALQHAIVLRREEQYRMALAEDSAFLRRFITLPFEVPTANFRKTLTALPGDEGINPLRRPARLSRYGRAAPSPSAGRRIRRTATPPSSSRDRSGPRSSRPGRRSPCACSVSGRRACRSRGCPRRPFRRRGARWIAQGCRSGRSTRSRPTILSPSTISTSRRRRESTARR
jgi:hypothetical protein